jgi:hypothetical protein
MCCRHVFHEAALINSQVHLLITLKLFSPSPLDLSKTWCRLYLFLISYHTKPIPKADAVVFISLCQSPQSMRSCPQVTVPRVLAYTCLKLFLREKENEIYIAVHEVMSCWR